MVLLHLAIICALKNFFFIFNLCCLFGCASSQLQHVGSSLIHSAHGTFSCGLWDFVS